MTTIAGVEIEVVLVLALGLLGAGFVLVSLCTRKPVDPKRAAWHAAYPPGEDPQAPRAFVTSELAQYDGKDGRKLFVGAKGKVFDVGYLYRGWEAYGPGAGYSVFAARDASVGLATMALTPVDGASKMCWDDLTTEQQKVLDDWVSKFEDAYGYPVVGFITDGFYPRKSVDDM